MLIFGPSLRIWADVLRQLLAALLRYHRKMSMLLCVYMMQEEVSYLMQARCALVAQSDKKSQEPGTEPMY